jgi:hypothetical protein
MVRIKKYADPGLDCRVGQMSSCHNSHAGLAKGVLGLAVAPFFAV